MTKSEQSHQGAVSSSPSVQSAYDATGASSVFTNAKRRTTVTYPSGRVVFHEYATADALEDRLSIPRRVRETNGSGTVLVEYSHPVGD